MAADRAPLRPAAAPPPRFDGAGTQTYIPPVPIYEYLCERCGKVHEVFQKANDKPPSRCDECGARKLAKLVSRSAFQLKGGGWYSDLYASRKPSAAAGSPADGPAAAAPTDASKGAKDAKESKGPATEKSAPAPAAPAPKADAPGPKGRKAKAR
jgi:putative FmdB family regulatory protein